MADNLESAFDIIREFNLEEQKLDRRMQELFGNSDHSETQDEFDIIWNDSLTHEQKVAKLHVLRGHRPKRGRFSKTDRQLAKDMGIRL